MQNLLILGALGLAAYRATQFVVHDTLADPVRDRIEMWHARKFESKVRTFVRDLLSCIYCVGFHLSWITLVVYLVAAGQWGAASIWVHAVEAWAVAGIQALLSRIDDTLPVRA